MERTGGRLDALFNNGAYAQGGAVEDLSGGGAREQFEANFFGWHDLTRRAVVPMRAAGRGRIVQCSSILGLVPVMYRGAYAASKHALEGLTLCLRAELQGSGVHVSLIEPGPVKSRIAVNALAWFLKNIDHENSAHREAYKAQLTRLTGRRQRIALQAGPEAVYKALRHALHFTTAPAALRRDGAGTHRRGAEAHPACPPLLQDARSRAPERRESRIGAADGNRLQHLRH